MILSGLSPVSSISHRRQRTKYSWLTPLISWGIQNLARNSPKARQIIGNNLISQPHTRLGGDPALPNTCGCGDLARCVITCIRSTIRVDTIGPVPSGPTNSFYQDSEIHWKLTLLTCSNLAIASSVYSRKRSVSRRMHSTNSTIQMS